MKHVKIEVIPNGLNDSGFVFVVYKRLFPLFWYEIGRCITVEQLRAFAQQYKLRNGRSLEHAL